MNWRGLARLWARGAVRKALSGVIVSLAAVTRGGRAAATMPLHPRSILVIRLDLFGDLLFSMPAVQGLRARYPDARIVLLTLPYVAALAAMHPEVDDVIAVDTNRIRTVRGLLDVSVWLGYLHAWRSLRDERFDLAIAVNGRTASLCAALSGAKFTAGYAGDSYPFTLDLPIPGGRYRERMHEVEYGRRMAAHITGVPSPSRLSISTDPASERRVHALLESLGVSEDDVLVVVHVGSLNGSAKRWPVAHWTELANRLGQSGSLRLGMIGAAMDAPLAREVAGAASVSILDFTGETTLPELVSLVARAHVVVTGDSGPLHLAVALGRPVVSMFGPTDPQIYGPYRPTAPAVVLRADISCSPCYQAIAVADCPLGDPICMRLVTVDWVESAVRTILGQA